MATTQQQRAQRLGDVAQRAQIAYFRTQTTSSLPTGRYAEDGEFFLDFTRYHTAEPYTFPGDDRHLVLGQRRKVEGR